MNYLKKTMLLLGLLWPNLVLFAQPNTSDVINNNINYYAASYGQHAGNGANGDTGEDDIAIQVHMETNNGLVLGPTCSYFQCYVPCDPPSQHQHQASETNRPFNTAIKAVIEGWESDANADEVCTYHSYDDNYAIGSSSWVTIADYYPNQFNPRGYILGGSDNYDANYLTTWRFTHGTGWQDPLDFGTLSTSEKTVKDFGSNQPIAGYVLNPGAMSRPNVEGNASGEIFYSFTLGAPAPVTISTDFNETNFDTHLVLFDGAHNQIALNDDVNSSNLKSKITATLLPGKYLIRVEGFDNNTGQYKLQVQLGQITSTYYQTFSGGNIQLSVDAGFPVKPACTNDGVRAFGSFPDPGTIQNICDNKAGYFVMPRSDTDHYPLKFTWNTSGGSLQVYTGDITNGLDPNAGTTYTNFGSCPGSVSCLSFDYVPQRLGTNTAHHYAQLMAVVRRDASGNVEWSVILPIYITGKQGVVRGETLSPSIPTMVVHDPPGDASYASIASAGEACHGYSIELSQDQTTDVSATVKLGVEGSVGLFVETDYSVYAQVTASMEVGVNKTTTGEYQMCYKTTNTFSTSLDNQSTDDLFIGSVTKFIYGFWYTLQYDNNTCNATGSKEATFAPDPNSLGGFFFHPESEIRNTIIPNLQAQIAANCIDDPNSPLCHENLNQLSIWQQALANNDNMKANAGIHTSQLVAFSGGGSFFDNSTEITTNTQESINTSLYVEEGFAVEAGAEIGGSGVSGGVGMKTRFGFGAGTSGSNTSTNTITYHLQDNDPGDLFATKIYRDGAFGTPLFKMETTGNQTSCPYEGGIQLDQPHLTISNSPLNTISVSAAPGTPAVFNVNLCNNSPVSRTYYLKLNAGSNLSGAVVKAAGVTLNGNDFGQQYTIPANDCLQNLVITIEQGTSPVENYPNLEIYLYPLCEEDYTPQHSSIIATAFFGPANDLACNAILIPANGIAQMGYSNEHATVSNNEAILAPPPSNNDCVNSWCENGGNQINNSVWFKFVAPNTGSVEVSTCGLTDVNTQIATYSAADCNNFSDYTLLAANDDRVDGCGNNPYDSKMNVSGLIPGQIYYVIVDGWNGSAGTFGIKITTLGSVAVKDVLGETTALSVTPNPSSGRLYVAMAEQGYMKTCMISDMTGKTVKVVPLSAPAQNLDLDLSTLPKGVYLLQVGCGGQLFTRKVVLQ